MQTVMAHRCVICHIEPKLSCAMVLEEIIVLLRPLLCNRQGRWCRLAAGSTVPLQVHRVSKKTSTHIIGYKLRNSCPILIIFHIKIPHII